MKTVHWYGTVSNTPVGVLDYGGTISPGNYNKLPELLDYKTGAWRSLTGVKVVVGEYPFTFTAPNGRTFVASKPSVGYIDLANTGKWINGPSGAVSRLGGTAVYMDDTVYVLGGGLPPVKSAQRFDLQPLISNASAIGKLGSIGAPNVARTYANAVTLPDGTIYLGGGTTSGDKIDLRTAEKRPELRNPATGAWVFGAPEAYGRLYHSVAVLLADGRVLSSGGGLTVRGGTNMLNMQIYSPPYLFRGDRPVITSMPATVRDGQQFTLQIKSGVVSRVTMVGLGTVTHAFNSGQRFRTLTFSQAAGSLTVNVTAPANNNLMPAGYYMLFAVNDDGIPSTAKIVKLTR
jgi:hypothetical protein